ncbi:hypothetical protein, partial [Haliea atlantica]
VTDCLHLVFTTGLFFNKVNQAESLDCSLARVFGRCGKSNSKIGFRWMIQRIRLKPVVQTTL